MANTGICKTRHMKQGNTGTYYRPDACTCDTVNTGTLPACLSSRQTQAYLAGQNTTLANVAGQTQVYVTDKTLANVIGQTQVYVTGKTLANVTMQTQVYVTGKIWQT